RPPPHPPCRRTERGRARAHRARARPHPRRRPGGPLMRTLRCLVLLASIAALVLGCAEAGGALDGSCRVQADCALGERCDGGTCAAAACDDAESPCALGERCAAGQCETDPAVTDG